MKFVASAMLVVLSGALGVVQVSISAATWLQYKDLSSLSLSTGKPSLTSVVLALTGIRFLPSSSDQSSPTVN